MRSSLPLVLILLGACATAATIPPTGNPSAAPGAASSSANPYYVCHGNKKPKWKRVAESALAAHRRHGDRIVSTPQRVNTACTQ